jgi:Fe-S oxidoreductase
LRALRFEAPNWLGEEFPFEVVGPIKVWADAMREGRLRLEPGFHKEAVTFQDSCNFIRNGGYYHDARLLMHAMCADFREMKPGGNHTYCCGMGGGNALMPEFKKVRLATGRAKAESIRATGAGKVVVACHNCEDGIRDIVKEYGLDCKVELLCNFLAEAVWTGRPSRETP